MKALIDTNVILDVALNRAPFARDSTDVLRWAEADGEAAVSWHSLSNCAYLLKDGARDFLENLLRIVDVAPGAHAEARHALSLPMKDVEDALQAAAAFSWKADYIVTRDPRGYAKSPVPAISPAAFLRLTKRRR